ncbi:MAG: DUF58 domain-containing protein [Lachnospiraceae bacterium]|nr:DUF58 domain-containing protein [Lachnospiraceae bacterium]
MEILFAILGAFVVYTLQGFLYSHYWDKGLTAELRFSRNELGEGESCQLKEVVMNRKLLPIPMLHVKFQTDRSLVFEGEKNLSVSDRCYKNDIFSLMMYQKITRTLNFTATKRGLYWIDKLDLVSSDLFMRESLLASVDNHVELLVYPAQVDVRRLNLLFKNLLGTTLTRQYSYEDPFEFRGIRQYQSYDSMKDVNWKASAKTGELKVNVHDYTARQEVIFVLNLKAETMLEYDSLKEESIRLVNSLAALFTAKGVPVGVISNGRDVITNEELYLPTGSGRPHMQAVRERLARIDLKQPAREIMEVLQERNRDKGLKKDSTLYVMVSYSQRTEICEEFKQISRESKGSMWILPLLRTMEQKLTGGDDLTVIRWEVPDERA